MLNVRIFCTNVIFYLHVTREKLRNDVSYEKFARLMLMKLTPCINVKMTLNFILGSHNEDAFVHVMPGCRVGHPMDRQVDPGRVGLPILRRLHDPSQAFPQISFHAERTRCCKGPFK